MTLDLINLNEASYLEIRDSNQFKDCQLISTQKEINTDYEGWKLYMISFVPPLFNICDCATIV